MTGMNAVATGAALPMATEVKLPNLGQGMESGTIVRWLKSEGESVKKREPLYELDTDKVTQEVESDLDGVLLKIVVPEGEVEVGSTIAVIEAADGAAAEAARRRSRRRRRRPRRRRRRPSLARSLTPAARRPALRRRATVTRPAPCRSPRVAGSRRRHSRGGSRGRRGSTSRR